MSEITPEDEAAARFIISKLHDPEWGAMRIGPTKDAFKAGAWWQRTIAASSTEDGE